MQTRVKFLRDSEQQLVDDATGSPAGSVRYRAGETYSLPVDEAIARIAAGDGESAGTPFPQRLEDGSLLAERDPGAVDLKRRLEEAARRPPADRAVPPATPLPGGDAHEPALTDLEPAGGKA